VNESHFGNGNESDHAVAELEVATSRSLGSTAVAGHGSGEASARVEQEHRDTSADAESGLVSLGEAEAMVSKPMDVDYVVLTDGAGRTYAMTASQKSRIMSEFTKCAHARLQQISNDDLAITSSSRRLSYSSSDDRAAGERFSG
jgi:hypothetical protein